MQQGKESSFYVTESPVTTSNVLKEETQLWKDEQEFIEQEIRDTKLELFKLREGESTSAPRETLAKDRENLEIRLKVVHNIVTNLKLYTQLGKTQWEKRHEEV